MSLKQLMKLPDSSNIPRSATQSWSKLGSLLKDNFNAESVFYAQQYGQYELNCGIGHWIIAVTEMKARIRGVQVHMQQFEFFFGLVLGCNLLMHTVSLSVCVCVCACVHACVSACVRVCVCKESRFQQLKVYHWLS